MAMTDWNQDNPFDLGVHVEDLGLPTFLPGARPEGYTTPKLPIPPVLDPWVRCRSPEAMRKPDSYLNRTSHTKVEYKARATEESQASTSS